MFKLANGKRKARFQAEEKCGQIDEKLPDQSKQCMDTLHGGKPSRWTIKLTNVASTVSSITLAASKHICSVAPNEASGHAFRSLTSV